MRGFNVPDMSKERHGQQGSRDFLRVNRVAFIFIFNLIMLMLYSLFKETNVKQHTKPTYHVSS